MASAIASSASASEFGDLEVIYTWSKAQWEFKSPADAAKYESDALYKRASVTGVHLDSAGNIYMNSPRWMDKAIPGTLNRVVQVNDKPVFRPFPSWEMNQVGDLSAFQNVIGFAIDTKDRMWVLDAGFVAGVENTQPGAQKIVVLDLATGKELKRLVLGDELASLNGSFLNDVTVDEVNEFAYISDSGNRGAPQNPTGIIVYDFKNNTARRVLNRHISTANDPTKPLMVNGENVFPGNPLQVGINGIAVTGDGETLFWGLTTGHHMYSIPAAILRNPKSSKADIEAAVVDRGEVGTASDGLIADRDGNIYVSALTLNAVLRYNAKTKDMTPVAAGPDIVWVDTFSWGKDGWLYFTTNHLHHQFSGSMTYGPSDANFRLWRVQVKQKGAFQK